jgi:hypothetical protein
MFDDPVFGVTFGEIGKYVLNPYVKKYTKFFENKLQHDFWYSTGIERLKNYLEDLLIQVYWPRFEQEKDKEKTLTLFDPLINLILNDFKQNYIPVFTTNYDPIIESYCEFRGVQLEYGFERTGARHKWNQSRFTSYVPTSDKRNLLLFKLHGSLSWRREGKYIYDYGLSLEKGPGSFAVIYPTQTKEYPYEEPFKTAYTYLEDYLKSAKVAIAIGYSFRDKGIGYVINEAQDLNNNLKFVIINGQNPKVNIDTTKFAKNSYQFIPAYFEAGKDALYLGSLKTKLQNIII